VLVLHGLRLRGFVPNDAVAEALGVDGERAGEELAALEAEGFVQRRNGRVSGFSLTAAGRVVHERALAEELDAHGVRDAVDGCYRRFLEENGEVLELCSEWQVREVGGALVLNDHDDAIYDASIVRRLAALDERIQPVCAELGRALGRLARYGPGLRHARDRVQSGDGRYVAAPELPSYHALWFELHEDLLVTLGLERSGAG
jgi:hypothetical protein